MKVLLINGSPHERGCTYTALSEVANAIQKGGIETEIFHIGTKPIRGCMACKNCSKPTTGFCNFDDDSVNTAIKKIAESNGIIVGSSVHYASASASLCAFMERIFYGNSKILEYKPAASVVSARRSGTSAAFDRINKFFTISNMPIVSSQYWNSVHGNNPEEVKADLEGLQIMRTLGNNMVWLLKSIEAGKNAGLTIPEKEKRIVTSFIR